ncbi:hypothetical protein ABT346_09290 [Micromonospora peucetia]|uniref:hypothetical protein n=1 Tax=Micromonospora peucetia TaxID=47871 RepID=UPI00332458D4
MLADAAARTTTVMCNESVPSRCHRHDAPRTSPVVAAWPGADREGAGPTCPT